MWSHIKKIFEELLAMFSKFYNELKQPDNFAHYADILAIPFFFLTFIYFARKSYTTHLENMLLIFSLIGLIVDSYLTWQFLTKMGIISKK